MTYNGVLERMLYDTQKLAELLVKDKMASTLNDSLFMAYRSFTQ